MNSALPKLPVNLQAPVFGAVMDRDVGQPSDREDLRRQGKRKRTAQNSKGSHRSSPSRIFGWTAKGLNTAATRIAAPAKLRIMMTP